MMNIHSSGKSTMQGIDLGLFSMDELKAIHYATLDVFADPGILVTDVEARGLFKEAGCDVDENTQMVKIPEHVVDAALRVAPSRFRVHGREKKHTCVMEADGKVHWTNFGTGVKMSAYDESSGKYVPRDSTEQDIADTAKLCDWAENIDMYCMALSAMDVAGFGAADLHETIAAFTGTSKHAMLDPVDENFDRTVNMMEAFYGGDAEQARKKPIGSMCMCPTSPLELGDNACQMLINSAREGLPNVIISMAMGGASSPVHLAGTLVTHNAEVLASVILAQIAEPGAPVWYGSSTTSFDLKKGTAPVGCPEIGLISASVAKLAQFYGLPSFAAGA